MTVSHDTDTGFDAWNPGLESRIPLALEPMITLYGPGNTTVDYSSAKELSDFCGLSADQLIVFSVKRLIVHELLVRVTCDLSVPDGPNYEDLGINLRTMVKTIYQGLMPDINRIQVAYDARSATARHYIEQQLSEHLFDATLFNAKHREQQKTTLWYRLFKKKPETAKPRSASTDDPKEFKAMAHWSAKLCNESDPITIHCLAALTKIVNAIVSQRGRVINEPQLLATIATNYASNKIGDELVSELVGEQFESLVEKEGYRMLPLQKKPVVMNVKGASASGKSTIRPQQIKLADKLDIPWDDFALISPDYWRKYLLDYESLGDDYKYAAMLTGQELEIVDRKLDRYMADKAENGEIPHLLIDRFRFDSFNVDDIGTSHDSKLLSRFGDRIFLFFMITPPTETVVRAWSRGQSTGRYKAVDDLLYHNVEAYTGMPALFLSWVLSSDKTVHFEFLDNDVPKGDLPKTAAFGWNNRMTVLDVELMLNIDSYRQVNVDATSADKVLPAAFKYKEAKFLHRCIETIQDVSFAEPVTEKVYARFSSGKLLWWDKTHVQSKSEAPNILEFLLCFTNRDPMVEDAPAIDSAQERKYTLGRW